MTWSLFKSTNELCDTISLVAYCPFDGTVLLIDNGPNEYWIPTVKVFPGNSWNTQARKEIQEIFGNATDADRMLRFYQVWIPNFKVTHLHYGVFEMQVSADQKKRSRTTIGKFKGKIRWVTELELKKYFANDNLKTPELLEFYTFGKGIIVTGFYDGMDGFKHLGSFVEINERLIVTNKSNIYEQIVDAAGLDREVQEVLFREFLVLCFPSNYMSFLVFTRFVLDLGWNKEDAVYLFRAADVQIRNGIAFREFLYFLAAIEPGTNHAGPSAELRCRYIFRYFDTDRNHLLKYQEFKNLVTAMRKAKKQSLDNNSVVKEVSDSYKNMGYSESHELTITEFLKAVGDLKLRGTSQIFRASYSIKKFVKEIMDRESRTKGVTMNNLSATNRRKTSITFMKGTEYDLAVHTVKVKSSGETINVDQLFSLENAVSISSTKQPILNDLTRRKSFDLFNQASESNELLKALRYLTQINKTMASYQQKGQQFKYNWGPLDSSLVARHIIEICQQVKPIFMKESRLLEVSSPVYIMGDLHGNFADLLFFEKIFWHIGPSLCPSNLLFLGDYVDRGAYSIEVISYLLCYKLQSPHKINLLRGNHEIKRIQMQWTFEKECKMKFGDKVGQEVFLSFNEAFDRMPIAAVIDGRIFCCHGGVPPPWLCPLISAVNDIPVVLNLPQEQSPLAWELMWNDPVRPKNMTERMAMELLTNEGFATNTRRGTAHVFSVEALENFLKVNGLTHFVRAHEVAEVGFTVQQKGKLMTVFSSSKYCGGQNEAACVLVDQGKLRILRVDTHS